MSHDSHSFTPVQQPQRTNKPDSIFYKDAQIWTATRCQRLLRPIASRIELLKKDPVRFTSDGESHTPCQGNTGTIPILNIASSKTKSSTWEDDACWRPARNRIRKTYSTRCKLKDDLGEQLSPATLARPQQANQGRIAALLPGEISVPTPILNRSQVFVTKSPHRFDKNSSTTEPTQRKMRRHPQSRYTTKDGDAYFQLAEAMRRLRTSIASNRYKIYEGIYNALEALLRVTLSRNGQPHLYVANYNCKAQSLPLSEEGISGSRSLLSTCLRAVPNYIKEEERWRALGSENKGYRSAFHAGSVLTETYSDLESLGTSCSGWTHLKSVVRAHGVQSICDAIRQGFIDARFASALVMLCIHASAPNDAEAILSSLLMAHQYPHPQSSHYRFVDVQAMLPLATLDKFVRYTSRTAFYHRQMTRLIINESLPLSWLGTRDCGHLWTSVFRALSTDPCDRDATAFLTISIPSILFATVPKVGERDSAFETEMLTVLNNTISSVLRTLSTMSLLHINHTSKILQLLRSILLDCQLTLPKLKGNPAVLIATANIIVGIQPYEDIDSMRPFIEVLTLNSRIASTSKYMKEGIPDFICAVSRCCGRGSSGDGFEYLTLVLERLKTFASLGTPDENFVMRAIIANSAFAFAQQLPSQKSLEYAHHIGKQMQVGNNPTKSSTSVGVIASTAAFRWEDGISEWVTASPLGVTKGQESKSFSSDDESDLETPIRPSTKRQKHGVALPQNPRFVRYGRCLNTRVSDLSPASPIDGDEDLDPLTPERHQIRKKFSRLDKSSWTHSRNIKHGNGKRSVSKTRRGGYGLICVNQDWRLFACSDDELNSLSSSTASTTGTVMVDVRNRTKSIGSTENTEGKSSEQSEDELGLQCWT